MLTYASGYHIGWCRFAEVFHYLREFYWTVLPEIRLIGIGIAKKRKGKLVLVKNRRIKKGGNQL